MNKILFKSFCIAVLGLFLFSSCKEKNEERTEMSTDKVDLTAARAYIDSMNKHMGESLAKGDSSAIAATYADDAKILGNQMATVEGKQNITGFWGYAIRMGWGLKPETTDLYGNNDLLVEEGKFLLTDNKGAEIDHGKYIVLWKKIDGKWKLYRDIYNTDVEPK